MSIYDITNIEKTDMGIIPNRGLVMSYDVKKAFKNYIEKLNIEIILNCSLMMGMVGKKLSKFFLINEI